MNKLSLLFFLLLAVESLAQDPHMREPKSVEELLEKNNPLEYRALKNHDHYLVIDKIGTKKRIKKFIGDEFGFRNTDGVKFFGELKYITDSTFTLMYFDQTENKYENRLFYVKDVELIFKRNLKPGLEYNFTPAIFIPFVFDWIYFKRPPWQNTNSLVYLAGIEAARVLVTNRQKFYNRIKLGKKKRLIVLQY
ncbi:MAG: hypothetical protein NXI00_06355 [Cytophagales bacterium]|nr:hypothetical protein [Cytophagales bacterium]